MVGTIDCSKMCFISRGTPGTKNKRACPSVIANPGAVPMPFGRISAPSGKSPCFAFDSGITRPNSLNFLPNPLDDAFVTAKLYPRSLRRRLRCDVIGRRSEPACHDHDTMRLGQPVDDRHDSIELVVHGEVLDDVEAQLGELLAQPRGVGVHQLATGELGANR